MTDIIQFENKRLLNIEAACQLLTEAKTIEEVAAIRNHAEVVRVYAQQVKAGLQAQNEAAEIKIRAERRAGEMLAAIERIPPEERGAMAHGDEDTKLHLSYMDTVRSNDIGPKTAHNWQRIAKIPEQHFEAFLQETKEAEEELTTAKTVRKAVEVEQANRPPLPPRQTIITPANEWDALPSAKAILDIVTKTWRTELERVRRTADIGKLSPEGKRFLSGKLKRHASLLMQWAQELEESNG
jgi:hypothetical protein